MIRCLTRAVRWLPGGRIIRYSAAQVAARRAARIVCWTVVTFLPALPAEAPPPDLVRPWPGAIVPWGPVWPGSLPQFLPIGAPAVESAAPTSTPEPGTLAVLGAAAVAMWRVRRCRTN
jgi:hypothetical protein